MSKEKKKKVSAPIPKPNILDPQVKPAPPALEDKPVLRQVTLETDGNMVMVTKNTTSGNFELLAILQAVINLISKQ